jgi:hypothetical protein
MAIAALAPIAFGQQNAAAPQTSNQSTAHGVPASPGQTAPQVAPSQPYTDAEIKLLVGPVALYPDSLLANTLTACLYPDQVAEAARMCASGKPPTQAQIDATNWELPVKSIAAIPTVVNTLNQYPDWMRALGAAYLKQSSDVMRVVQQLRKRAIANGTLKSDEQQSVVQSNGSGDSSTVTIVPMNPQLIAVPMYSPEVVYADPGVYVAGYPPGYWGYAGGVYVGPSFGVITCDWYGGYCAWDKVVYNPAWDHVGIAGVNALHNEWNRSQGLQNAASALASRPGAVGSALRGVGDVGSPYRPDGGGLGRVNGPSGYEPSRGGSGGGADGAYGALGDRSAFSGDRRSSASSERGAWSNERSVNRGGGGGGGRR